MSLTTAHQFFGVALLGALLLLLERVQITFAQFEGDYDCEAEGTFTPTEVFDKLVSENRLAEVTNFFCAGDELSGSFPEDLPTMPLLAFL